MAIARVRDSDGHTEIADAKLLLNISAILDIFISVNKERFSKDILEIVEGATTEDTITTIPNQYKNFSGAEVPHIWFIYTGNKKYTVSTSEILWQLVDSIKFKFELANGTRIEVVEHPEEFKGTIAVVPGELKIIIFSGNRFIRFTDFSVVGASRAFIVLATYPGEAPWNRTIAPLIKAIDSPIKTCLFLCGKYLTHVHSATNFRTDTRNYLSDRGFIVNSDKTRSLVKTVQVIILNVCTHSFNHIDHSPILFCYAGD